MYACKPSLFASKLLATVNLTKPVEPDAPVTLKLKVDDSLLKASALTLLLDSTKNA
jgi:hypothetical protein